MKFKKNSILAVDLDGTLCSGESFTEEDCLTAKPKLKIIDKINKLNLKGHYIIIYTARKEKLRNATTYWLRKYGVRFQVLAMEKVWASYYIDDRNVLIKDL